MLRKVNFDLTQGQALDAVRRLYQFHSAVNSKSGKYLPTLVLNDGAIAYRDLSTRTISVTYDFLTRCIELFEHVNRQDQADGFPGARCVIAAGYRLRSDMEPARKDIAEKAERIQKDLRADKFNADQAIHYAMASRPYFSTTPELQGNFAFTKAYLVDSAGSKGGFAGPHCFIDCALFADPMPGWISFDEFVRWSDHGLNGSFGRLKSIDKIKGGTAGQAGVLDALGVAQNISKNPDSLQFLKERIKSLELLDE